MAASMSGMERANIEDFSGKFEDLRPSEEPRHTGTKTCGCKGIRSCVSCEKLEGIKPKIDDFDALKEISHVYCPHCDCAYPGWDCPDREEAADCEAHRGPPTDQWSRPDGVHLLPDFVSENEERTLMEGINEIPWVESQSGRKKQDFGPKVNFKKRKVRCADFLGFPPLADFLLRRFWSEPLLQNFLPVELCHLNYDPGRGSAIDPHVDDAWLWGERLVTLSLGAPTILTLAPARSDFTPSPALRVPLPRRSLLVLRGDARHRWTHAIYRQDVRAERIAMTFRELAPEFATGGAGEALGQELLRRAGVSREALT